MYFLFTNTPLKYLVEPFWRDEAFSYLLAKKSIVELVVLTAKDFNPPLYYLLLHFWIKIVGGSEISLRLLSFLFYLGTIYVSDHIMQDIYGIPLKKRVHYLLLIAINPILLYYAFEARMYTMLAFFATLSYYSFFLKKKKLYYWSIFLGLFTHYFMSLVILSQFVYVFVMQKRKDMIDFVRVVFPVGVMFLLWLVFIFAVKQGEEHSFWIMAPAIKDILYLPAYIYTGYEKGFQFFMETQGFNSALLLISATIFSLFIVGYLKIVQEKKHKDKDILALLFIWSLGIPLFIFIISFFKPLLLPRYLIFSSVGLVLLIIYLLHKIDERARVILFVLLLFFTWNYHLIQLKRRDKQNPAKVLQEIGRTINTQDYVYVSELDYFVALYYMPQFENRIFVYHSNYEAIPSYVGKVLIPRDRVVSSLPFYPQRAYVVKDNSYEIQAQ